MTQTRGDRRTPLADPTGERSSDPVPVGDDVLSRESPRRGETPRRYEEELDRRDPARPADDKGKTHD